MTSLTAPWDKNQSNVQQDSKYATFTDEELVSAKAQLHRTEYIQKFPKVERMYADPLHNNQVYSLHSFVPAKGAKPDSEGVFGFMKFRGTFATVEEANERAEFLIRNVDSYHSIQTGYVGRPFPVCVDTDKFVKEKHQVDISKKAIDTISEDIKQKRLEEKKEMEDIKEREKKLLEETQEDYVQEPLEKYTTLQVKKANLVFTYVQTQKKLREMQPLIQKAYQEIREMDAEDEMYRQQYYTQYKNARKQAGLPEEELQDNFMKYLCEDAELDFEY